LRASKWNMVDEIECEPFDGRGSRGGNLERVQGLENHKRLSQCDASEPLGFLLRDL